MRTAGAIGVAFLCAALSGCGTNVRWLLTEESRLTPEADRLATTAEALENGIERPIYAAEDAKLEACRFLTEAAVERIESEPTLAEQFVSDLSAVVVLLVPIEQVERCAESLDAYRDSIAELEHKLIDMGVLAGTTAPDGSS